MAEITLPPLPYPQDALEPHISAKTMSFHYGKHHQTYVNTLNTLIKGTEFEGKDLESIIKGSDSKIFNNAAQVWNHTFFWETMSPKGSGTPSGPIADAINGAFGSVDKFKEDFVAAAVGQFGSGWAWLVKDGSSVKITTTSNADLPLKHGQTALLTVDVWEHAYYLDYQNVRPDFVKAVINNVIDWDNVNKRLAA